MWTRFFQEFGGERTYQGPVHEVGVRYRFATAEHALATRA